MKQNLKASGDFPKSGPTSTAWLHKKLVAIQHGSEANHGRQWRIAQEDLLTARLNEEKQISEALTLPSLIPYEPLNRFVDDLYSADDEPEKMKSCQTLTRRQAKQKANNIPQDTDMGNPCTQLGESYDRQPSRSIDPVDQRRSFTWETSRSKLGGQHTCTKIPRATRKCP